MATGSTAARVAPGLLLAFVLPWYAVSCALLPARRLASERWLLTLGLSLAVSVVVAVVLDQTPWGLSPGSWAVALAGIAVTASGLAAPGRARASAVCGPPAGRPGLALRSAAVIATAVAAASFAAGALMLARTPADSRHVAGYSVLWTRPTSAAGGRFAVGVQSSEFRTTSYRLLAVEGRRIVLEQSFELPSGGQWTGTGAIAVRVAAPTEVRILLYRTDLQSGPYRHVSLNLPASSR